LTDPAARGDAKVRPPDVVPLDRFNAFSDGVFAIAITLLVLELTVPVGPERLLPALVEQWPEFLGYLISFAFIGGSWNTHARMTRLMKRGDGLVSEINLLFLLFVAVLPFSTSLMVTHLSGPDVTVAVLIYGLNVLAASLMLTFLMAHLVRERALLTGDVADDTLVAMTRQRRSLNVIWIIGVLCALVVPPVAIGLYMVATAMLLVLPIIHLRRARGSTSSPGATVD
jgi:uncharacterized membrane protein